MRQPIFDSSKFLLIAGPCSLENEELCCQVAEQLKVLKEQYRNKINIVFKASFDKANRTDVHSRRGIGIDKGLEILAKIKQQYKMPVLTDVHLPGQAERVGNVCDVLQIPAFLCRQTDLLEAVAKTKKTVNVKKGQFLSPYDMKFVVDKLRYFGAEEIWQTDRGTTFGYGNLVVDMRSFPIMAQNNTPVILDATHSLQMPGNGIGITGGDRQFILPLSQAAIGAGANGLFIETHPDPNNAWSDKATQLPLTQLSTIVGKCIKLWENINK